MLTIFFLILYGDVMQYRDNAWACWAVSRGTHEHRNPMLIYMVCLYIDFVGSTNTINICLILSISTVLFL